MKFAIRYTMEDDCSIHYGVFDTENVKEITELNKCDSLMVMDDGRRIVTIEFSVMDFIEVAKVPTFGEKFYMS